MVCEMKMRSWLASHFGNRSIPGRPTRIGRKRPAILAVTAIESLESRRVMSAGAVGVGPETRINAYTLGSQAEPAVAMDHAGDYVIAWSSQAQDGSGAGIYAQRFSAAGTAQGTAFKVNSYTTGNQSDPTVAMDASGDFAIAWESQNQDASDGGYGVYAQRYNAAGAAQGSEFRVNTYTLGIQTTPSIAMDDTGNFVVTWLSSGQLGTNGQMRGIYGQRFSANGVAAGSEFQINSNTTEGLTIAPNVAMDGVGDFVVVWEGMVVQGPTHNFARRYSSAGIAQGNEFNVSSSTTSNQSSAKAAMNSTGSFVIAFTDSAGIGGHSQIMAQRYNASGVALGGALKINTYTMASDDSPAVAMDAAGDFVVAWDSFYQDGSHSGVFAQRFLGAGTAQGTEFPVNSYTFGQQIHPTIANDSTGNFLVTWQSYPQDGSAYGVYAQRYQPVSTRVNHAPAGTAKTVTTLEDTPYAFKVADFGFTDQSDSPPDSFVAVKITTLPSPSSLMDNGVPILAGTRVPVTEITAGKLKFVPAANGNGPNYSSFTFQVQDSGGTANGGVDTDATARRMTIAVTAVNDAPAGTTKTATSREDATYAIKVTDFGFTDPNDNPANALLAVKITTLPSAGTLTDNNVAVTTGQFVSATDIIGGKLIFKPKANLNGGPFFLCKFQVQDNGGTANGGVNLDAIGKVLYIQLASVNDAPVGTAKTVSTAKNTAYTFKVADFGFTDLNDTPPNTFLAVKITTLPVLGRLTDNGVPVAIGALIPVADIIAGKLKFTPATNGTGANYATFNFQVRDNGGTTNGGIDTDLTPRRMTISVV